MNSTEDPTFMYHFVDSKLLIKSDIEIEIIYWGALVLLFLCAPFYIYYAICIPRPIRILNHVAVNHFSTSYLHIACIAAYNLFTDKEDSDSTWVAGNIVFSVYATLDLLIIFLTACMSLCSILRIFIPELAELYTKKDMALFATISIAVMELYEYLFCLIYQAFGSSDSLQSSLRLTSVSLLVSATVFILVAILFAACLSAVKLSLCLVFAVHISVYLLSDLLFILYNFYTSSKLGAAFSVILVLRLVLEMVWFVVYNSLFSFIMFVDQADLSTPERRVQDGSDEESSLDDDDK